VIVSFVVSGRRLGAARFNVDGSLDRSYGKLHGRAQNFVDFKRYYKPYLPVLPQGLALLPDGSAIIGGWVTTEFCDDPEECPAGAESTDEPMLIKLSPRGLRVPSFGGGKSDPTDHYSITSLFEPYDGSLSIQATTDGKILAALNTTVEQDDNPGDGQGWEADAPEITKIDASGRLDKSFGTNGQLTDPLFPAAAGYISSDKLQATGFSVSVSGSIALCGVNRRGVTIPGDPSHAQRPGFLQIVDLVSAADDAIPATNLTRTTSYTDEIEGCAWQSEGKLLAVDLNGTLTVSRYLP
jgi:hypothetical protein